MRLCFMRTASLPFRFHAGGNSLRGPFPAVARPMFAGKDSAEKLPWRGLGLPRSAAPLAPTSFASAVQTCTTFFGQGGSQKCAIFYGKDPKATLVSLLQNFLGMAPRKKCWDCLNFFFFRNGCSFQLENREDHKVDVRKPKKNPSEL